MKIPIRLKQVAEQIVNNARRQRRLNAELNQLLENMGVDLGDDSILEPIASLEGDCTPQLLYEYLEGLI